MEYKNIYLRTNLYIIRDLYKALGKSKKIHSRFYKTNATRVTLIRLSDILDVNYQRLNRILQNSGGNQIFESEAIFIGRLFNIPEKLFNKKKRALICNELPIEEWGCYYEIKYKSEKHHRYNAMFHKSQDDIKRDIAELPNNIITKCENGNYNSFDDIWRVWWFFTKGQTYIDDIDGRIKQAVDNLEKFSAEEWMRAEKECVEDAANRLQIITDTLRAFLLCKEKNFIKN